MFKKIFLLSVCSMLAINAVAKETEVTIYNDNLALVKKSKSVHLNQGKNGVVFDEIAQQIKPESVYLYGDDVKVLEQSYDYAGINYASMLRELVGKEVNTVRENNSTGEQIFEKATLLAVNGAQPILKFAYGIETNFPGRVVFDDVSEKLNVNPILKAKVYSESEKDSDLNLLYLTSGLHWNANYVAKINDDKTFSLNGKASITNNSGTEYDDVKVSLVAGNVKTVNRVLQPRLMMAKARNMVMSNGLDTMAMDTVAPANLEGYHIYNIAENTDLKNEQTKQVSLINADNVNYEKHYEVVSSLYFSEEKNAYKNVHPEMYYRFNNDKESGLGMPMPEGKVSFYAKDNNGSMQFIGENMLPNKAEGEEILLNIGKMFDVYSSGEIVNVNKDAGRKYKKNANDRCLTSSVIYTYKAKYLTNNSSDKNINFILKQPILKDMKVVSENVKGVDTSDNMHEWNVDILPHNKQVIEVEYSITIDEQYCNNN